jgi:TolA-binding protein
MPRRLAAGAVAVALAATAARGADRAPHEADLGAKRSVAPDAALGGSLEAKKPGSKEPGGPALDFEKFRKHVEVQVSDKRREEIASLRRLIELGGGSDVETPQWYFRLAELLWEESQYFFFEANRRDDRLITLGTRGDPREIDRLMAEKKDFELQQKKLRDQAVALYGAIIKRYPKYPRLDEVLYFLAENLSKRDRHDADALKAYGALIERFPKSRFVADAWMAVGEHWFDLSNGENRLRNLKRALGAYRKAAEYQESSVYGYALYKQAWVHYNVGGWSEALDLFRAVIFFGELPTATIPADRKLALVKEARKDYVRTYSHVGSAEGAADEFKRIGGEAGWIEMLKSLAGIYFEEGKDRDAIVVYHRLIQEKGTSPEAAFFQSRVVTCAGRMGRKDAAVQQAHVFVKMLRGIEAAVGSTDEKGRKAIADARRDAEQTLRVLAVQYHNEWKKTRDDPVAAYAAAVYRDYLDVFPNEPTAYEMRFFHAELRYALGDFEGAGEEYERVALQDLRVLEAKPRAGEPPPKPGKFFKDALESAVFAWDVVAKKLDDDKKPAGGADPTKRVPLAPQRQRLLDACSRYLQWQPKGDKWVEIAYKAARIHYQHNAFGEATDLFTRIALDHPTHELAGYSTNLVLDAYNLLGDWRNVNGWAKRFHANAKLLETHPALKADLAKIVEESAFKVIEEKERAKDHEGAAEEYLAFVRDWPGSRLAATALFNASVDWVKARRIDKAVEVRNLILQKYPAHELAPAALYDNAEAYEAIAEFERAAALYERYFELWRASHRPAHGGARGKGKKGKAAPEPARAASAYDEKKATDGLINAAVFRAGLRQWAKAEAASRAYLETWPNGADAPRIFRSLADLYAKQGQTAKQIRQLEEYQHKYAKDPEEWLAIQHQLAQLHDRSGGASLARRARAQGLDHWRRNKEKVKERGLALVAEALLDELEPTFAEYDRITLNVAPKFLKSQLQVKANKLKKLEEAYGQVVRLKQAEPAVCALTRIGLAYQRFAQALYDAPIPKEIRREAALVEEYRSLLSQQAEPLETKALDGLALAVNAARDHGVVNDCARQATAILVKRKPDEYGPSPRSRVCPSGRRRARPRRRCCRRSGSVRRARGKTRVPGATSRSTRRSGWSTRSRSRSGNGRSRRRRSTPPTTTRISCHDGARAHDRGARLRPRLRGSPAAAGGPRGCSAPRLGSARR